MKPDFEMYDVKPVLVAADSCELNKSVEKFKVVSFPISPLRHLMWYE